MPARMVQYEGNHGELPLRRIELKINKNRFWNCLPRASLRRKDLIFFQNQYRISLEMAKMRIAGKGAGVKQVENNKANPCSIANKFLAEYRPQESKVSAYLSTG